MQNKLYIFGSLRGGCGKTECSLSAITALDSQGIDVDFGEIDEVRRLSEILTTKEAMVAIKSSPSLVSHMTNESMIEFFNPVAALLDVPHAVLDLGANVSDRLIEWGEMSDLPEMAEDSDCKISFFGVSTTDGTSFSSAVRFLKQSYNLMGDAADYVLIVNDIAGVPNFDVETNPVTADEIKEMRKIMKLGIIYMPHCPPTKAVNFARTSRQSIYEIYAQLMEVKTILARKGDPMEIKKLKTFLDELGLADLQTHAEKRLFINQQTKHVANWIKAAHGAILAGLGIEESAASKKDDTPQVEDA